MKKFFLAAVLCVSMISAASALDSKTVLSFDGHSSDFSGATASNFGARMYNSPLTGLNIVWGGSFYAPGSKDQEVAFNALTGVAFKSPVFGDVELVAYSGKSLTTGAPIKLFHTFALNKNFLYNVNEKIQLGFTVQLARFAVADNGSYVGVLTSIDPVLSVNVSLF
jgi:hypothetical protein